MIGNSTVPIFQHFFLDGFRSCPRDFFKSNFFGTCLASQSTVPSVLYSIFGAVCCNSFGGNVSKHHLKNQLVRIKVWSITVWDIKLLFINHLKKEVGKSIF